MGHRESRSRWIRRFGAWLMDVLWTETLCRSGERPNIEFRALPNKNYADLADQLAAAAQPPEEPVAVGRSAEVKKGNLWETWADFLLRSRQWGDIRDLLRVIVRNDPLLWQRVYTWEQQAGGPPVPGGTLPPH